MRRVEPVSYTHLFDMDEPVDVIIPAKALLEVERNLNEAGEREVSIAIAENHAMFRIGTTTYVTRLLEGQFPNYKQVFPQNIPARIICDRPVSYTHLS